MVGKQKKQQCIILDEGEGMKANVKTLTFCHERRRTMGSFQ